MNVLIAGFDEKDGPQLFYMDYLASLAELKYAAHGYGGFFALSIIDRYYLDTLSREEGIEVLRKCIKEVQQRMIVNLPNFKVQLIDAHGIHNLPDITPELLANTAEVPLITD